MLMTLTVSVAAGLYETQIRTHSGEVYEAGEGNNPAVHCMDYVATIELEEATLDTLSDECSIKQRTDQKSIG